MLVILHAEPVEVDGYASGSNRQRYEVAVVVVLLDLSDETTAGERQELCYYDREPSEDAKRRKENIYTG